MVDNVNPTNQFHPYQPQDAVPQTNAPTGTFNNVLRKVGIDPSSVETLRNSVSDSVGSLNTNGSINKARDYARANPAKVLGGLAALVIGAGLIRRRNA